MDTNNERAAMVRAQLEQRGIHDSRVLELCRGGAELTGRRGVRDRTATQPGPKRRGAAARAWLYQRPYLHWRWHRRLAGLRALRCDRRFGGGTVGATAIARTVGRGWANGHPCRWAQRTDFITGDTQAPS